MRTSRIIPTLCSLLLLSISVSTAVPAGAAGTVGDSGADAVWGQTNFTHNASCPTVGATTLCGPDQSAVDANGDLWVADYSDSRVLMYPSTSAGVPSSTASKVLGQTSMTGNSCNQGQSTPSATTICNPTGVAVDSKGTVYVSEAGNNRVSIYYNAATYTGNDQPANLVLGQPTFSQNTGRNPNTTGPQANPPYTCPAPNPVSQCTLENPIQLSVDSQGDLLVAEYDDNRVMVWKGTTLAAHKSDNCTTGCYIPADGVWGQGGFQSFSTDGANSTPSPADSSCPTSQGELSQGVSAGSGVEDLTEAPDGNVWFTENAGRIGRIAPSGAVTEFAQGITANSGPLGITVGPDGNVWFTEESAGKIGRITPSGAVTEFTQGIAAGSMPYDVTAGPDGSLWFTEYNANQIGRITPSGTVTEFPIPTANSEPEGITLGPDGNLWFTETSGDKIGRVTPSAMSPGTSQGITEYTIPTPSSGPYSITAGPDGNLWFTEFSTGKIGQITLGGAFTEFSLPGIGDEPTGISAGPDGDVWFAESGSGVNSIGRITAAGAIAVYPTPSAESDPIGITTGSDGYLWFTEYGVDKIGRISPSGSFGGPTACTLANPTAAVADARGDLYIADGSNNRVLEYDGALSSDWGRQVATRVYGQQGSFTTSTANRGGLSPSSLSEPYGLGIDPAGNLWVADYGNNRVLQYPSLLSTNTTTATTAVGVLGQRGQFASNEPNAGGADALTLSGPLAISFDPSGNAYVVDDHNNRVLEYVQPLPVTARIALGAGWNLVSLPGATSMPYTAATIVSQINQQGGNATALAVYTNGRYAVYIPSYVTDFAVNPTQGFFVLTSMPSVWGVT